MRKGYTRNRERAEGFELNITSIIDCFTVLIAFLLVSASFVSIGVMDSELAAAGATQVTNAVPGLNISLGIKTDHSIRIDITGQSHGKPVLKTHYVPARSASQGQEPDYSALSDRLAFMKGEWPEANTATLTADAQVSYREVIKTMETAKKAYPSVLLGGF